MSDSFKILSRARELITERESWLRGQWAADKYKVTAPVQSDAAVCFCSVGAIQRASMDLGYVTSGTAERAARLELAEELEGQTVMRYNDTHTHREVLEKFDSAIQRLKPV